MNHKSRDLTIIGKMLNEISDIESFTVGLSCDVFAQVKVIQKAVIMTMINIGELSKSFSDEFIAATKHIPWRDIRGLRNLAAHHYEAVAMEDIWHTIEQDIPKLRDVLIAEQQRIAAETRVE